ncbi:MAG: polyprenol phosphomannose-dependent alpha 1,6 mannosyltransferase MptB [Solirubrobacterales bacterium]|nr:polyprenol phosphomannose-dependent alpha 1,6 mannosyltransferase MptB [Solirubrobacterales bacterium]
MIASGQRRGGAGAAPALWGVLGLAGSMLIALAAPHALHDSVVGWWYAPRWLGRAATPLIWIGMVALAVAWLGLGRRLPGRRTLLVIAAAWMTPLALAPPLFSRDLYSYLAQGTILHLGANPYQAAPIVLHALGRGHVLAAVSPFWRHTTAPYGPLFLELVSVVVGITGSHLIGGVLLTRALQLVGVAVLAVYAPQLGRRLGTDARRALWLTVASPLFVLSLVAAGHNDALMAGLLVAGVTIALDGRPLTGIGVCAVAATIKLPALAGAVFIAVAWARAEPHPDDARRLLAAATAIVIAVLGLVTLVSGVGLSWISSSVLSTPAKVRLAITPGTALGYTIAWPLHQLGLDVSTRALESAAGLLTASVTAIAVLALLWRVRVQNLVELLGAALLIAAAGGPAAWPWYFGWGLVLVAAEARWQPSRRLVAAIVLGAFVVQPNGLLALPLGAAPAVLLVYLVLAGIAWRRRRGRGSDVGPAADPSATSAGGGPGARPSVASTLARMP